LHFLDIRSFVEDCNSALLATIDAEFAKVADMEPPQVSKGSVEESAGSAAVEELFPKVDISNQFTTPLLEECGDANWKVRKEGLEKVAAIVDANKRIKPNLGGLPGALKLRLADSNKNLQILTMEICASLAVAMGKPFDKYARILCSNVASCLTDQKDNVRSASIAALEAFATQSGLDSLVSSLATSLVTNSPTLRKDLLVWLTSFCTGAKERDITLPDLSPLAPPVLQCLQDRSVDVRKAGQNFLPILMANVGYDAIVSKCSDLKGAAKSAIMPMLEAAKPAPPPRPPSAAGAAKAPPPERGALSSLPSLARPGMKAGARPGTALPGAPSKIGAAKTAAGAPPTMPGPPREQRSSPIPTLPTLPSLPGPGQPSSLMAPRSRLTLKKPGQGIPQPMDSGIPALSPRISRLTLMRPCQGIAQPINAEITGAPAPRVSRLTLMKPVQGIPQPMDLGISGARAPRVSRLTLMKPSQGIPQPTDSGSPRTPAPRVSRLQDMQPKYDGFSVPLPSNTASTMGMGIGTGMGMQQRSFGPMEGVVQTSQPLNGPRSIGSGRYGKHVKRPEIDRRVCDNRQEQGDIFRILK
jgi:hypothetical protein